MSFPVRTLNVYDTVLLLFLAQMGTDSGTFEFRNLNLKEAPHGECGICGFKSNIKESATGVTVKNLSPRFGILLLTDVIFVNSTDILIISVPWF